jgi:hypothetical protein
MISSILFKLLNESHNSIESLWNEIQSIIREGKFDGNIKFDIDKVGNIINLILPTGFITLQEDSLGNPTFVFQNDEFKNKLEKILSNKFKYEVSNNLNQITIKSI